MFWNFTCCPGFSSLSSLYLDQGTQVSGCPTLVKKGVGTLMPWSIPVGAVDEVLDLSLGKGMGGQTRGSPPCLSPPISVACLSFLPHSLARTFSLVPTLSG